MAEGEIIRRILAKIIFCLFVFCFCTNFNKPVFAENKDAVKPPRIIKQPLQLHYPDEAKKAGIEGAVTLQLFIETNGLVKQVTVVKSSGHKLLDDAAIGYGHSIVFEPAMDKDGIAIKSTIRKTVCFYLIEEKAYERDHSKLKSLPSPKNKPRFVLPKELKNAATEFRVKLKFFINSDGKVTSVLVRKSSGFEAFDKAAVKYARKRLFYPAKDLEGQPVAFTGTRTFSCKNKMFVRFGQ